MDGARRAGKSGTEIRLLGPIEAVRDGEPVALGGPKPRALLTVLALDRGRVVSVDRLVEALWPGDRRKRRRTRSRSTSPSSGRPSGR